MLDGRTDGQTDGQTDGLKDSPLDRLDGLTDCLMNRPSYGGKRAATESAE